MENSPTGKLLLVGEGDFSFSVALSAKPGFVGRQIIATSLDSEESILKHQQARNNVAVLLNREVMVLYEVDCTQLNTEERLEGFVFSRIVFNFPHIGGKSNIKKNRALLNDFFSSAVQIIEPGGQIMVTLCKGQGGTPADYPIRAWHDSWQVVSMAANSGLILSAVLPFQEADYPQYNSVGFRSQDKGFHTEGALVHVFETAGVPVVPDSLGSSSLSFLGRQLRCPKYIVDKLNGKLLYTSGHPLCTLRSELENYISKEIPSHICFPEDLPVILETAESECHLEGSTAEQLSHFTDDSSTEIIWQKEPYILDMTEKKPDEYSVDERDEDSQFANGDVDRSASDKNVQYHLRSTLLEELSRITSHNTGQHTVASGDVYSQCCISEHKIPVSHELMVCQKGVNLVFDAVKTVCRCLESTTSLSVITTHSENTLILTFRSGLQLQCSDHMEIVLDDKNVKVGQIWTNVQGADSLTIVLLNLDLIVRLLYAIESPHLIWSQDKRFIRQFSSKPCKFEAFSIYILKHVHDMSFWESPDLDFDELCFSDIIRDIAADLVVKVTLVERYHDVTSDQWSRCYRLNFLSNDLALSYITSWKLQSLIRLETARKLEIRLR